LRPLFVDTGAWIAIAVARDEMHQAAAAYAAHLAQRNLPLLTTNYVLSEAYTRIRYDDGHARVLAFDAIVQEMTRKRHLTVRWVNPAIHEAALEIFRKYADHEFSVADCASFVVGREKKVHEVFGFDKDFVTMGFTLRPA